MKDLEEKLNNLVFEGCEDVLVGDILHYSLDGKKNLKSGIKDIICMLIKVAIRSNYDVQILGDGSNMTLFSSSYLGRQDHYLSLIHI